jgi:hypothetical protein
LKISPGGIFDKTKIERSASMTVLEFFLVAIPSLLVGALVMFLFFKTKKKSETTGDLHIFPDSEGYASCYVAWETDPKNLTEEDYVLLKVIKFKDSQE